MSTSRKLITTCKAQYVYGSVFIFKNIKETLEFEWLNLPQNDHSLVFAHCGGSLDFQSILQQFLSCGQFQMKKVKSPLCEVTK